MSKEIKMSDVGLNQMESHVDSATSELSMVQNSGKYPKKVCRSAMYGANMLKVQRHVISSLRELHDKHIVRITELEQQLQDNTDMLTNLCQNTGSLGDKTMADMADSNRNILEQSK